MDLANSQTLRSPRPLLKAADHRPARAVAFNLLFVLTLAAVGSWIAQPTPDTLFLLSVLCGLWRIHLQSAGRSWAWSAFFASAAFLGFLLPIAKVSDAPSLQFFGGALIVYGMLWSFAVFGRDEILRPLANIAFLLGVAIFASAATILSAVLISLIFFVVCRWKFHTGRWWDTALLIFTPAVFAALAIYGLRWLGLRSVYAPESSALWPGHYTFSAGISRTVVAELYGSFLFFAAVLLLRLLQRQSGRADLVSTIILALLVLAVGSPESTGVRPGDITLCLAVSSTALLTALPRSPQAPILKASL